ncbi:MAG: hypothetical protein ABIT38_06010, partial [Gemmatimonadaceae bacterium]
MCGICGVVVPPSSTRRVEREGVERMRDTMTHRGPDGAGLFIEEGVALGHRRLSIVDVAHGAQPMCSDDNRFHIVYNGEVYNHPESMGRLGPLDFAQKSANFLNRRASRSRRDPER